jgi:hypothetical protein
MVKQVGFVAGRNVLVKSLAQLFGEVANRGLDVS